MTDSALLDEVNELVRNTNMVDFAVVSFVDSKLLLVGSEDLAYYHQVEILFEGVSYVRLPVLFSDPEFRVAGEEESDEIDLGRAFQKNENRYLIEAETGLGRTRYCVVAERLSIIQKLVQHPKGGL